MEIAPQSLHSARDSGRFPCGAAAIESLREIRPVETEINTLPERLKENRDEGMPGKPWRDCARKPDRNFRQHAVYRMPSYGLREARKTERVFIANRIMLLSD